MKFFKKIFALTATLCFIAAIIGAVYCLYPLKYTDAIRASSEEMGVDPYFVAALIKAESNFKKDATSQANAKGLMQLTDETAEFCAEKIGIELSEGDVYDPDINIRLGVYYLKRTLDMFDSDKKLAIAAYNAGEGRVKKWLEDERYSSNGKSLDEIPYEETKKHVKKIEVYQKVYKVLYPNL